MVKSVVVLPLPNILVASPSLIVEIEEMIMV